METSHKKTASPSVHAAHHQITGGPIGGVNKAKHAFSFHSEVTVTTGFISWFLLC